MKDVVGGKEGKGRGDQLKTRPPGAESTCRTLKVLASTISLSIFMS